MLELDDASAVELLLLRLLLPAPSSLMLAAHSSAVARALVGIDRSAKAAAAIGATVRSVVQTDLFFSPPSFPFFSEVFLPARSSLGCLFLSLRSLRLSDWGVPLVPAVGLVL